jgi:hypothetical protein
MRQPQSVQTATPAQLEKFFDSPEADVAIAPCRMLNAMDASRGGTEEFFLNALAWYARGYINATADVINLARKDNKATEALTELQLSASVLQKRIEAHCKQNPTDTVQDALSLIVRTLTKVIRSDGDV